MSNLSEKEPGGPNGVGGWLLALIILLVLTPFIATIQTMSNNAAAEAANPQINGQIWQNTKIAVWIGGAFSGSLYLFSAVALWFGRKRAIVKYVIGAFWLAGPFNLLIGTYVVAGLTMGIFAVAEIVLPLLFSIAVAGAVTLYLLRSRRCRNTYSRDVSAK